MRRHVIRLFFGVLLFLWVMTFPCAFAEQGTVSVDWNAQLKKAQDGIEKNPRSAFWHNQAGVAYDALGDFSRAVSELKLASQLDSGNATHDYALYALYKRKGMTIQQKRVLLSAVKKDPNNPIGHFELGSMFEAQKRWTNSLAEYRTSKKLAEDVKSGQYVDPKGNNYDVSAVREEVDTRITRVTRQANHEASHSPTSSR